MQPGWEIRERFWFKRLKRRDVLENMVLTDNIVKCIAIARQRLGKHINMQANARNNRASIVKQQISKHTSLTNRDCVFCVAPFKVVIKKRSGAYSEELSFETPVCQNMSMGAEELN
jgi:hypothetical protein